MKRFNRESQEFQLGKSLLGSDCGQAIVPPAFLANDTHSKLNAVNHRAVIQVASKDDVRRAMIKAKQERVALIAAGGRHSMGGQQFIHDGILMDLRAFNKVLHLDRQRGLITVEPGIMWSELINYLRSPETGTHWSIYQKPTGADNITIAGSLSSNIHGRGLKMKPFVENIEGFEILMADGRELSVDRNEHPELFKLAVGGYGLFGLVTSVTLRLRPRRLMKRIVESTNIDVLTNKFEERIRQGHEYGDFQFAIDCNSEDFLRRGILATYHAVATEEAPDGGSQLSLSLKDWKELLYLAHTDKTLAFQRYEEHYLRSNGQLYLSDAMQLSTYLDDYHTSLDQRTGMAAGSEIITELYVPRDDLAAFMGGAREFLRNKNADVIYGTIRLIEQDDETFLPWAKARYACIIFNIHTEHSQEGVSRSRQIFTGLIDLAQSFNGSYYLTYHRFAQKSMVERSYPQFQQFLEKKLKYDPDQLIRSEWYEHYREMFKCES